jgi:hypothetical protein
MNAIHVVRGLAAAALAATSLSGLACGLLPLRTDGELSLAPQVPGPVFVAGGPACGFLSICIDAPWQAAAPVAEAGVAAGAPATAVVPGIAYAFVPSGNAQGCNAYGGACRATGAVLAGGAAETVELRIASADR